MQKPQSDFNPQTNPTSQPHEQCDVFFHLRLHKLRKQTNTLRAQLFASINEVCNFLKQNQDYKHLLPNLEQASFLLSQKNTQQLIHTIKQLEYNLKEAIEQQEQELDQESKSIETMQQNMQSVKLRQQQMNIDYEDKIGQIISRGQQFQTMQQQLQALTQECQRKHTELLVTQTGQDSFQRKISTHLSQNWSKQTSFIRQIIKLRAQTRTQLQRVNLVFEKLKQKLNELQTINQQYLRAKQQNQTTFEQNIKFNELIKHEEARKHHLVETKRNAVLNQEIKFAGIIAEDWSKVEQDSRETLFVIIKEINNILPQTQLINVQEILKSAETYFNNNTRLSGRLSNSQDEEQEPAGDVGI